MEKYFKKRILRVGFKSRALLGVDGPIVNDPDGISTIPCGALEKNLPVLTPTNSPLSFLLQAKTKNKSPKKIYFLISFTNNFTKIGPKNIVLNSIKQTYSSFF